MTLCFSPLLPYVLLCYFTMFKIKPQRKAKQSKTSVLSGLLFTGVFLPVTSSQLSACTRGSSPCMYVKWCFLMRSPPWTTPSALNPTRPLKCRSKTDPTHNCNHHPKSVARKLLSSSIISFLTSFILSSVWTHTSTHSKCVHLNQWKNETILTFNL